MAPWILSSFIECAPSQTSDVLRVFALIFRFWAEKNLDCVQRQNVPAWVVAVMVKTNSRAKVAITVCHGGKNEVLSAPGNRQAGRDDFSSTDVWRVYANARTQSQAHRRGFSGPKERIRQRTDLPGRKNYKWQENGD
jgi:hypothetical protein